LKVVAKREEEKETGEEVLWAIQSEKRRGFVLTGENRISTTWGGKPSGRFFAKVVYLAG